MRVIGIDASLRNFGLAIADVDVNTRAVTLDHVKLISTETDKSARKVVRRNSEDLERCRLIQEGLAEVFTIEQPQMVFVEMPVGSQNARAMASYGMSIGILASIAVPLIQVTPYEVKLAAVGTKTATKGEMIEWARRIYPKVKWFGAASKNEHVADATAAIVAGVQTDDFKGMLSVYRTLANAA